jgi:NDP-sugar pyrophosphorylase family protein
MKVLVLAAGDQHSEFEDSEYPLCLTEFDGMTLLESIARKCAALPASEWIFAMRERDVRRYHLDNIVRQLVPNPRILIVRDNTRGAACTALLAAGSIDNDDPLLIVSANEVVDVDLPALVESFQQRGLDAGTIVFPSVHPRYSYVRLDPQGFVLEAAEKNPISSDAMAGIHWFARGRDFVRAAMQTIRKDANVDGSYYVSPTFNELVLEQALIGVRRIESRQYHPLKNRRNVRSMTPAAARTAR